MPFGITLLVVASILALFGVGHQVLDRMRLNDKTALLFMAAILLGACCLIFHWASVSRLIWAAQ